jgi:hypothetical protein
MKWRRPGRQKLLVGGALPLFLLLGSIEWRNTFGTASTDPPFHLRGTMDSTEGRNEDSKLTETEKQPDRTVVAIGAHSEGGSEHLEMQPYKPPDSASNALVQKVRSLQVVQEKLAHGDMSLAAAQRDILAELGKQLDRVPAEQAHFPEWYAGASYLLSGGQPTNVEPFLKHKDMPPSVRKLLEGAIAYVKGDEARAAESLRNLDPGQFPSMLAGHLTMIQSKLNAGLKPEQRRELLKQTTNLLPGTLLEEAALRRLMELATVSRDQAGFLQAAQRYQIRFSRSIYSAEYRRAIISGILAFQATDHVFKDSELDSVIFAQTPVRRNDILHTVARIALSKGQERLCRYASGRLSRISTENSVTWTRATLYNIACSVVGHDQNFVSRLKHLNISKLPPHDQALQAAALRLATQVQLKEVFGLQDNNRNFPKAEMPEDIVKLKSSVASQLAAIGRIIEESQK